MTSSEHRMIRCDMWFAKFMDIMNTNGCVEATKWVCWGHQMGVQLRPPNGCVQATKWVCSGHQMGVFRPPNGCVDATKWVYPGHQMGVLRPPNGCVQATKWVCSGPPVMGVFMPPNECVRATKWVCSGHLYAYQLGYSGSSSHLNMKYEWLHLSQIYVDPRTTQYFVVQCLAPRPWTACWHVSIIHV